jgi:hypothetical protein
MRSDLTIRTIPTVALAITLGALPLRAEPHAVQAPQQSVTCRPGDRTEVVDYGKWFSAVIIAVRADGYAPCRVHRIGYATTLDGWVPLSYLRAVGSGPTQPIPGGPNVRDVTLDSMRLHGGVTAPHPTSIALGHYSCVAFVANHLVHSGELTITGASTYKSGSTGGTFSFAAGTGLVAFHGGPYDGQQADYEAAQRPTIHIHGPSGRRVLDCEVGAS